jgi:hypothetical protein
LLELSPYRAATIPARQVFFWLQVYLLCFKSEMKVKVFSRFSCSQKASGVIHRALDRLTRTAALCRIICLTLLRSFSS